MDKFKARLLYKEERLFCTKAELLSFNSILPLAKLDIVHSRLVSNDLISSDDIPVDIQLVAFILLLNARELSFGAKSKKF